MEDLINESISFIVSNLHDIVRLPIDMICLSNKLIAMLAYRVPLYQVD
jgi:hypothetical protein